MKFNPDNNVNSFLKDKYCYTQETETSKSLNAEGDCNCKKGSTSEKAFKSEYNGSNCDIPGSVWKVPGRLDEGSCKFYFVNGLYQCHKMVSRDIFLFIIVA